MKKLLVLLALAGSLAAGAFAQLTRGTILGTVQDPSGAVVANAGVKISNAATQVERSTTTNENGIYRFPGVDQGIYTVTFTATGFSEAQVKNVSVSTSQEVTLNQTLAVGSTTNTVDVTDTPAGVELSKSTATIQRTLGVSLPLERGHHLRYARREPTGTPGADRSARPRLHRDQCQRTARPQQ